MQGTRGLATAKVVQQATEEPSIFVFGELLDLPQLQEVRQRLQRLGSPQGVAWPELSLSGAVHAEVRGHSRRAGTAAAVCIWHVARVQR